jgi:hypothetical protein
MPDRHDPSFRIMQYNRTSLEIINYEQYVLNLTEMNLYGSSEYYVLYDPITEYNMSGLRSYDWDNLYNNLWIDDELFETFTKNYEPNSVNGVCRNTTLDDCKRHLLCKIGNIENDKKDICNGN